MYLFDCADQTPVAKEYNDQWNSEMDDEHIDDKGFIVHFRLHGIVVNPTRTL